MKFESVKELLLAIYEEIKIVNEGRDIFSIPQSDMFYNDLTKKFNLIPFNIPGLIKMLVSANHIFSFEIVKEDRKNKILRIEGYVVSKGDIINMLKRVYEDELSSLFAIEFNQKLTGDRVVEAFSSHIDEFNNKPIGKIGSIAYNLTQLGRVLEWDIMKYSQKRQEDLLEEELQSAPALSSFISEPREKAAAQAGDIQHKQKKEEPPRRRAIDAEEYEALLKNSSKESVEKTIAVYGIDFYTRVCFRDYKFSLIQTHIESGLIRRRDDLLAIKKLLIRERANADKDMKIQEYAAEINKLEKIINEKLK